MPPLCTETVDRGHGRWSNIEPCGRTAVEDGLCKIHLRTRDRRREKWNAYQKRQDEGEQLKSEAERLSRSLGIDVKAEYSTLSRPSGYTGKMVVPLEWLLAQEDR